MPIDFRQRTLDQEKELEELLLARKSGIRPGIDATRAEIQAGRGDLGTFGGRASGLSQEFGIPVTGAVPDTRGLDLSLDEALNRRETDAQRTRINLTYNKAFDAAQNAGKNRVESELFARQVMQDEIRRGFEGQMYDKQRQQKVRQSDSYSNAVARGESLDEQYAENGNAEYQQAMYRILAGLPTQLLSYYVLDKSFPSKQIPTSSGSQPIPFGPETPGGQFPVNPYGVRR